MAFKRMRKEDPPTGTRRPSRGSRAQHFQAIARAGGWGDSARARMERAAALLAHNLLLREGEVGYPTEREFDPSRDLTWASVQWMQPSAASDGHEWALVHVVPIKDTSMRRKATPMPLRQRQRGGTRRADPLCSFDALRTTWDERADCVQCRSGRSARLARRRCSRERTAHHRGPRPT
eukprot:2628288-Pleurochrysis_carterae.AAC.1